MKKLFFILLCFILTVSLTGCSLVGDSADALMHPPRPTGDYEGIQDAIEKKIGKEIHYKYPLYGDYRSAIIRYDVDSDGIVEALAFYQKKSSASVTNILFLDYEDDNWVVKSDIEGIGNNIESVNFCSLSKKGIYEIVIGWLITGNNIATLSAYSYSGGTLSPINVSSVNPETLQSTQITYNAITCGDYDQDSSEEIVTIENTPSGVVAKLAKYYISDDKAPYITTLRNVNLGNTITSFISIKSGFVSGIWNDWDSDNTAAKNEIENGTYAVIIDALTISGSTVTEIICWDSTTGDFSTPLSPPHPDFINVTTRPANITSSDINGDGIIEVPTVSLLPGYSELSDNKLYISYWNVYDPNAESKLTSVLNTINNKVDSYYIIVPNAWENAITAGYDTETHTMYFYSFDPSDPLRRSELFRISAVSPDDSVSLTEKNYVFLARTETTCFYSYIADSNNSYNITPESVYSLFRLSK